VLRCIDAVETGGHCKKFCHINSQNLLLLTSLAALLLSLSVWSILFWFLECIVCTDRCISLKCYSARAVHIVGYRQHLHLANGIFIFVFVWTCCTCLSLCFTQWHVMYTAMVVLVVEHFQMFTTRYYNAVKQWSVKKLVKMAAQFRINTLICLLKWIY